MRFAIHGLPRSQSFWASQVLSTYDSVCLHEPTGKGHFRSMDFRDIVDALESLPDKHVGFAEALHMYKDLEGYREVVIHRSPESCCASLEKLGFKDYEQVVYGMHALLKEKMSQPGVLVLDFPVEKEISVVKLFQHCLGRKPTKSELRKASAKIFVPHWHVEKAVKLSREKKCL